MPWLRSEEMMYVELVTSATDAHDVLQFLGRYPDGIIQFTDLNKRKAVYERPQTKQIKPWEGMERQLRYFRSELAKYDIGTPAPMTAEEFFAPGGPSSTEDGDDTDDGARTGVAYESRRVLADKLSTEEETLKTLLANDERILHVYNQAREKKFVLQASIEYFNAAGIDGASYVADGEEKNEDADAYPSQVFGAEEFKFEHIMGVIDATKKMAFERMMNRVLRSLTFKMHFAQCTVPGGVDGKGRDLPPVEEDFIDPTTGESVNKMVFIISLRGPTIKNKVERICNAFEAVMHVVESIDPSALERELASTEDDITQTWGLCKNTRAKARATMNIIAHQIVAWEWIVASEKSILIEMNKFSSSGGGGMRGVGWIVKRFSNEVADAIKRFPNTLLSHIDKSRGWPKPPTHFFTNKFTSVFQALVDTYGVPRYREVNPAVFTAVTFPFLFGVMYGDIGHGFLLTLAGAYLLIMERWWSKRKLGEMEAMAFGGRYMLFMMGCFAVYSGFVYNDFFSLGLKFFTPAWGEPNANDEFTKKGHLTGEVYQPYLFGLDPTWKVSSNELTYQNSYKMKLSVILGVGQMTFGLFLRLSNSIYSAFKKSDGVGEGVIDIVFECIPQLVFMISIFGYLNFLILYKWCIDWDVAQQCGQGLPKEEAFYKSPNVPWTQFDTDRCSSNPVANNACSFPLGAYYPDTNGETFPQVMYGCNQTPPGIIKLLISMVLSPFDVPTPLFAGQKYIQWVLLLLAGVSVPMMLIPKPIILFCRSKIGGQKGHNGSDAYNAADGDAHGEGDSLTGSSGGDYDDAGKAMLELPDDTNSEHESHSLADLFIHQIIETIEFVLGCVSNTASYLRLWALSLAHAQLAATFWSLIMVKMINTNAWYGFIGVFIGYYVFAGITIGVLLMMDVLECFLHALRLHWVEFQNKFYHADGYSFVPFSFLTLAREVQGF
jgi:V-type H+-transporting ATPase subunit a